MASAEFGQGNIKITAENATAPGLENVRQDVQTTIDSIEKEATVRVGVASGAGGGVPNIGNPMAFTAAGVAGLGFASGVAAEFREIASELDSLQKRMNEFTDTIAGAKGEISQKQIRKLSESIAELEGQTRSLQEVAEDTDPFAGKGTGPFDPRFWKAFMREATGATDAARESIKAMYAEMGRLTEDQETAKKNANATLAAKLSAENQAFQEASEDRIAQTQLETKKILADKTDVAAQLEILDMETAIRTRDIERKMAEDPTDPRNIFRQEQITAIKEQAEARAKIVVDAIREAEEKNTQKMNDVYQRQGEAAGRAFATAMQRSMNEIGAATNRINNLDATTHNLQDIAGLLSAIRDQAVRGPSSLSF